MSKSEKSRVAISGGGITGATLLHILLTDQHLDVHIFKSASASKEAGMEIGVTRNTYQALKLMGPSIIQRVENAARSLVMLRDSCSGPACWKIATDEVDAKKDGDRLTSIVHRAAFLEELLKDVPGERVYASKKFNSAEKAGNELLVAHSED
ncbi:hypothetical protein DOTSEDRAFT_55160 [Dothistroma septosporum NZE10]|uniref:FAD-binding domain-containing protein n=1 Tax=Dothistroma septosporum (strain NZE10 / CBS 128990) TaxID=675120 RepID=N1PGP9_DOTSN|nr:hypothetical protein DOTSEDRAFT_55160 [Dothistroma septosporum NZE10]